MMSFSIYLDATSISDFLVKKFAKIMDRYMSNGFRDEINAFQEGNKSDGFYKVWFK